MADAYEPHYGSLRRDLIAWGEAADYVRSQHGSVDWPFGFALGLLVLAQAGARPVIWPARRGSTRERRSRRWRRTRRAFVGMGVPLCLADVRKWFPLGVE